MWKKAHVLYYTVILKKLLEETTGDYFEVSFKTGRTDDLIADIQIWNPR
jgi:hypothetical protein